MSVFTGAVEGGYRLDVAADETDVGLAEACLREGRVALGGGDAARRRCSIVACRCGMAILVGLAGFSFVEM